VVERLTYLCGIAVAIISWAIGQLVVDLTTVPVVYTSTTSSGLETKFEITNLSRAKQITTLTVNVLAGPECTTSIKPGGTEWTLEDGVQGGAIGVPSLMPGSKFFVVVGRRDSCDVRFGVGFKGATAVRMITGGVESFLLFNWLVLIVILVVGGVLVFLGSLWKAYQLSRPALGP